MERRNRKRLELAIEEAANKKERVIAYYNLGLFHDNNSRESEAIPNYRLALKFGLSGKMKSQALTWLASSLYKTGKRKEALKVCLKAQKIADKKLQKFLLGLHKRIEKTKWN